MIKLYSYWRSSASFRVRIVLNYLKKQHRIIPVNLLKNEQFTGEFRNISIACRVPVLVDGNLKITQSTAIIEYLIEKYGMLCPKILPRINFNFLIFFTQNY